METINKALENKGKYLCGATRQEKEVSSFKVGDKIAHTCNTISIIKDIKKVSKCFTVFVVDVCSFDGVDSKVEQSNTESRRYKNTLTLHFI